MDINNIINDSSKNKDVTEFDKVIKIRCYKEGNKHKTYITGIFDFLDDTKIKKFIRLVKKKLGCGGGNIGVDREKNKAIIFSGSHIDNIKNLIIEEKITDINNIK